MIGVHFNMESAEANGQTSPEEKSGVSAAQRRAEIRRRKLLMNSEDRMKRIVGFAKNDSDTNCMYNNPRRERHCQTVCIVLLRLMG